MLNFVKYFFLFFYFSCFVFVGTFAFCKEIFVIPQPARIGGTVTIDDQLLTSENDEGYKFIVSREDCSLFSPSAEQLEGLNKYNWYVINIPIRELPEQPNGTTPGEVARIHVYKNSKELTVLSPENGLFTVSNSGATTQLNLTLEKPKPELIINSSQLKFEEQPLKTSSSPSIIAVQNVSKDIKHFHEIKVYGNFYITSNSCGTSINSGSSCQIAIQFSPQKLGKQIGELLIKSDSVESPQIMPLSGIGIIQTGDINGDTQINILDMIITLKICNGIAPNMPIYYEADVNNDGKIAIEEAINILYFNISH
jgi:hypothetical protein